MKKMKVLKSRKMENRLRQKKKSNSMLPIKSDYRMLIVDMWHWIDDRLSLGQIEGMDTQKSGEELVNRAKKITGF